MRELPEKPLAAILALLFSFALFFSSLLIINSINGIMLGISPDYGIGEFTETELIVQSLIPLGIITLFATIALIVIGLAVRREWIAATGSIALYLPIFGAFSSTMFFLAGIGLLRVLWLPVIELNSGILRLGNVVLFPDFLLKAIYSHWGLTLLDYFEISRLLSLGMEFVGITIFIFGATAWLYGKFRGLEIVDFWLYRYSRHPQYLGYLLWSYGLLLQVVHTGTVRGNVYLVASLPWLVGALVIVGICLGEELRMLQEKGELYATYRSSTSFLIPLPQQIVNVVQAPMKVICGSNLPKTTRDILVVLLFYGLVLIALSIPFVPYP